MIGVSFLLRFVLVVFWIVLILALVWGASWLVTRALRYVADNWLKQYEEDVRWWTKLFLVKPWRLVTVPIVFTIMVACILMFMTFMFISGQGAGGDIIP